MEAPRPQLQRRARAVDGHRHRHRHRHRLRRLQEAARRRQGRARVRPDHDRLGARSACWRSFGALVLAEVAVHSSARRRQLRLPARRLWPLGRLPLGLGRILDHPLRLHRRPRHVFTESLHDVLRYASRHRRRGPRLLGAAAASPSPSSPCSPSSTRAAPSGRRSAARRHHGQGHARCCASPCCRSSLLGFDQPSPDVPTRNGSQPIWPTDVGRHRLEGSARRWSASCGRITAG